MKTKTLNLQIVVNLGNYESLRLGAEWTPDNSQDLVAEMHAADLELRKAAAAIIDARKAEKASAVQTTAPTEKAPQTQESVQKKPLRFDSQELQSIIKRMEAGVPLERVLQHYEPDEQALNVLKLAGQLNSDKQTNK